MSMNSLDRTVSIAVPLRTIRPVDVPRNVPIGRPTVEEFRQRRDELVEVTQSRLETLDRELARLDQQIREMDLETRTRWDVGRGELNRRRRLAWERLHELSVRTPGDWPDMISAVDAARQDLAAAIALARHNLHLSR